MTETALKIYLDTLVCAERGGAAAGINFSEHKKNLKETIYHLLHASSGYITLTQDATDGINIILSGLSWKTGDEIITTDQEHEAMRFPLSVLKDRYGITVNRIQTNPKGSIWISELEKSVTSRTKLIAVSHVTCETGTRLPVKEITAWAKKRKIITLIDGAQSVGAVPVHVDKIGCDFFSGNGHKWLGGPRGTGFLYCRKNMLDKLHPAHVGAGSLEYYDDETFSGSLWNTGSRFEYGTRNQSVYPGMIAALDWMAQLGWEKVYGHIASVASYAKEKIRKVGGVRLLTPENHEESSGLVSFCFLKKEPANYNPVTEFIETIRTEKIIVRYVPRLQAVRISCAPFVFPSDIDKFTGVLKSFTAIRQ